MPLLAGRGGARLRQLERRPTEAAAMVHMASVWPRLAVVRRRVVRVRPAHAVLAHGVVAARSTGQSNVRMVRAGTPATSVAGGTSRLTTAPAATTAPSPIVTPPRTVAPAPSQTLAPI